MGKVGTYRPFGLGQEDIKEMAEIDVDPKAIERTCHQLGQEVEGFYRQAAEVFMTGKVIPIKPIPKLYICMDATGSPCGEGRNGESKREGREWTSQEPRGQVRVYIYTDRVE